MLMGAGMMVIVRLQMRMVRIAMRMRMDVFVMIDAAGITVRVDVIGIRHDGLAARGASASATHRLSPLPGS
jgi:hypothetical protein